MFSFFFGLFWYLFFLIYILGCLQFSKRTLPLFLDFPAPCSAAFLIGGPFSLKTLCMLP